MSSPTIGVFALQGDVREHLQALEHLGVDALPVLREEELARCHGLVLPGGDSTTMIKLARSFGVLAAFRERIAAADGVLFCTPEYNRGVPGVLKNAIDVGSRPYGQSVWDKKPAAIISASPGGIGGFGASHQPRQA